MKVPLKMFKTEMAFNNGKDVMPTNKGRNYRSNRDYQRFSVSTPKVTPHKATNGHGRSKSVDKKEFIRLEREGTGIETIVESPPFMYEEETNPSSTRENNLDDSSEHSRDSMGKNVDAETPFNAKSERRGEDETDENLSHGSIGSNKLSQHRHSVITVISGLSSRSDAKSEGKNLSRAAKRWQRLRRVNWGAFALSLKNTPMADDESPKVATGTAVVTSPTPGQQNSDDSEGKDSYMRSVIPCLPLPIAIVMFIFNFVAPGTGNLTIV